MHCCVVSVVVAVSVVAHRELLLLRRGCRGAVLCALRTLRVLHSTKHVVPPQRQQILGKTQSCIMHTVNVNCALLTESMCRYQEG